MADGRLEVQIGADVKELNNGFNLAAESIKRFSAIVEVSTAKLEASLGISLARSAKSGGDAAKVAGDAATNASSKFKLLSTSIDAPIAGFRNLNIAAANFGKLSVTTPLAGLRTGLDNTAKATQRTREQIMLANRAVSQSNQTYQNFGRVIQDLPYGFQGIQNNLTQLIPSIGAFGLAFSVAVAALTFAQTGLTYWIKKTKDSKEATDDVRKANEAYIESLDDVAKAALKGSQASQEELVNLRIVYERTQDVTRSYNQRKKAVDQLQSEYPKYFANIKDEVFLAGGATAAYNKLAESILATSRARAAASLIADNQKTILVNQRKEADLLRERIDLVNRYNKAKLIADATSTTDGGFYSAGQSQAEAAYDRIVENTVKYNKLVKENNKLQGDSKDLIKSVNIEIDKGGTIFNDQADAKERATRKQIDYYAQLQNSLTALSLNENLTFGEVAAKKVDLYTAAIKGLISQGVDPLSGRIVELSLNVDYFSENKRLDGVFKEFSKNNENRIKANTERLSEFITVFDKLQNAEVANFQMNFGASPLEKQRNDTEAHFAKMKELFDQGKIDAAKFNEEYAAMFNNTNLLDRLIQLQNGIRDTVINGIGGALGDLGSALGEALVTGENVIGAIGNSILQSLGQFLGQLGDMLIQYGVAAQVKAALDAAIAIPGAGLIAGAAAIAAGIALKAAAGAFSSVGRGSGSSGSASTPSSGTGSQYSARGAAYVANPSGPQTIYLTARGRDLVAVLDANNLRTSRTS